MLTKLSGKKDKDGVVLVVDKNDSEKTIVSDEYFILKSFEESPKKGFDLLFRKYYTNLCNHAIRFVYSKELAEDIVAEVFANVWQNKVHQHISTSFRSYLYTAVRYRAYTVAKLEIHRGVNVESNNLDAIPSRNSVVLQPDQIMHFHELTKRLDAAIQHLPPQSRKAFQLNRLEGKKYAEVAVEMEITLSAVERLISRALAKIREELISEWTFGITFLLNII
jgi:RNA polymerase sigma-70 factor (ECF subfamily)